MQYVLPGGDIITVATDSPAGLVGTIGVKLLNAQDLSVTIARTTAGIIERAEGDGQSTYRAILVAPTAVGTYIAEWDDGTTTNTDSELVRVISSAQVLTAGGSTFATADDVLPRLGRALTATETGLLDLATLVIADAAEKDEAWANALDPVPVTLKLLCIELVVRAINNPTGATSVEEALGSYSHRERFDARAGEVTTGFELDDDEVLRVRRAVYGSNVASPRANDIANHLKYSWVTGRLYISEDIVAS